VIHEIHFVFFGIIVLFMNLRPDPSNFFTETPDSTAERLTLTVFALLSALRALPDGSARQVRHAMSERGLSLFPRFDFWIRVCRSALLADYRGQSWTPTILAPQWLVLPALTRWRQLVNAWADAVENPIISRRRTRLLLFLTRFAQSEPPDAHLSLPAFQRELESLSALGVWQAGAFTPLGKALFPEPEAVAAHPPEKWFLEGDTLRVPYPPDWGLVWTLEKHLTCSGWDENDRLVYPLTGQALRAAAGRGPAGSLPAVLKRGLGELPPDLPQRLAATASARALPGPVVEFSDPGEIRELRVAGLVRSGIAQMISPRHLHLEPLKARRTLSRLARRGVIPPEDALRQQVITERGGKPVLLTDSERALLIAALYLAGQADPTLAPPPGLLSKLTTGISAQISSAAADQARQALDKLQGRWNLPSDTAMDDLPPPPPEIVRQRLEAAIARKESLDVLYQPAGRKTSELRRISPFLLEQRGRRWYVLAYCHLRRGNRTFRLDRMTLDQETPAIISWLQGLMQKEGLILHHLPVAEDLDTTDVVGADEVESDAVAL
jgi:hypothetical protein